jgi:serine/threonine protein kinase
MHNCRFSLDHHLTEFREESPIPTAKKIGRYEIRSKLGEGDMGEVYLALDSQLDRPDTEAAKHTEKTSNSDHHNKETINEPPLHSFFGHAYRCAGCTRIVCNLAIRERPNTNTITNAHPAGVPVLVTRGAPITG